MIRKKERKKHWGDSGGKDPQLKKGGGGTVMILGGTPQYFIDIRKKDKRGESTYREGGKGGYKRGRHLRGRERPLSGSCFCYERGKHR